MFKPAFAQYPGVYHCCGWPVAVLNEFEWNSPGTWDPVPDSSEEVDAEDEEDEDNVGEMPEKWWLAISIRFPVPEESRRLLLLVGVEVSKRKSVRIRFNCWWRWRRFRRFWMETDNFGWITPPPGACPPPPTDDATVDDAPLTIKCWKLSSERRDGKGRVSEWSSQEIASDKVKAQAPVWRVKSSV